MTTYTDATDAALADERGSWDMALRAAEMQHQDDLATIADLRAQLAAALRTPALFGSTTSYEVPGPVPLARAYSQPGERPTDWQADYGTRKGVQGLPAEGGTLWISPKVNDADWLVPFAESLPAGISLMVSPWHEPENDGTSGHDLAGYKLTYQRFQPACDAAGALLLPILMNGKDETLNRRYLDTVLPYIGALGFDAYNAGIQHPGQGYQDPEVIYGKPIRLADEYGLDLWIGETGSGCTPDDTDGSQRIAWVRDKVRPFIKASPIKGAGWWTGGATSTMTWTPELFAAWTTD